MRGATQNLMCQLPKVVVPSLSCHQHYPLLFLRLWCPGTSGRATVEDSVPDVREGTGDGTPAQAPLHTCSHQHIHPRHGVTGWANGYLPLLGTLIFCPLCQKTPPSLRATTLPTLCQVPEHPEWLQPDRHHKFPTPRWPFCHCLSGLSAEGSP